MSAYKTSTGILKIASLILLTSLSQQGWAATPWEEEGEEDVQPATESSIPAPTTDSKDTASHHPAMMEQQAPKNIAAPTQNRSVTTEVKVQTGRGDHLSMPVNQAEPIRVNIVDFPRRGMSTDKVQNELGRPSEIIPAIGKPPITRWVYDDRIVYFEHSAVVHVVAK